MNWRGFENDSDLTWDTMQEFAGASKVKRQEHPLGESVSVSVTPLWFNSDSWEIQATQSLLPQPSFSVSSVNKDIHMMPEQKLCYLDRCCESNNTKLTLTMDTFQPPFHCWKHLPSVVSGTSKFSARHFDRCTSWNRLPVQVFLIWQKGYNVFKRNFRLLPNVGANQKV